MKKFLVTILACALVLSFAGLTMAADEAKPAAPPATPAAASPPAPAAPATTPAVAPPAVTPAAPPATPVTTPAAPTPAPAAAPTPPQAKPAQTADDIKWIAKCIADNKDEGQSLEVVQKYCECMNEKMDDNETQSVTQWEKKHPKEQKECSDKAGWK